ncbi:L-gulonolactone D-arabinono-1,4-lactone oxidase [Flagelloscypha sp. PMI_526]|nr:L-gulonolactone D-arabinono-1,4-lactone oxidase [Flagelloscypha sp. PMI_526]
MPALSLDELYDSLRPITVPRSSPYASYTNWGLSYTCTPLAVFIPENEEQCRLIIELARREKKVIRAVGVGHSPSDLGCTNDFMIRTDKLNRVLEVNVNRNFVVAQAGITLHDLHPILAKHGLAMINVGSISDQTLGGIVTTATHGSGMNFGVISTNVLALTLLLADGSRVSCSRTERPDLFTASICGLGSTGIIMEITLEVEKAFRLREVQESLPWSEVVDNLDALARSEEHVRLWWYPAADVLRVSQSSRTAEPANPVANWFWDSTFNHHFVQFALFLGIFFPFINVWITRFSAWRSSSRTVNIDESHRIFNLDCGYPQFTTEWAIPYEETQDCLRELRQWLLQEFKDPDGLRPHFPIEIRWSAPDDIWLSPSNGHTTTWIGIIQYKPYKLNVPYRKLFSRFEAILIRHRGRPHWAKSHGLQPEQLRQLYPKFDDFVSLLRTIDPNGMFRNEYVQRHIFGAPLESRLFKKRRIAQA